MVDQAEIHRMVQSKYVEVRRKALIELCSKFTLFSDKNQAWKDIIQLTEDKDLDIRWTAAGNFGSIE